jgi:ABC-type transport system involved in multi-copper enzyme maturation permease subunit
MIRLVRAEWLKLFTTRVWLGLLLGACVMAGAFAALFTGLAGVTDNGRQGLPPIGSQSFERVVLAVGANASVLFLILGIIGVTQEFRHRTATPTFLTTPQRSRVLVAKLVGYALAAVPFALLTLATGVLVAEVYAGARGSAPSLTDGGNLRVLGGVVAVLVLYAVIGVGVGALLRNQVGAIVGALVFLYVVEPVISSVPATASAFKWLPGGAAQAMTATVGGPDLLTAWQGAVVLLGYGLVAAVLGTVLTLRRDIT